MFIFSAFVRSDAVWRVHQSQPARRSDPLLVAGASGCECVGVAGERQQSGPLHVADPALRS